jgi:hypothetical protein
VVLQFPPWKIAVMNCKLSVIAKLCWGNVLAFSDRRLLCMVVFYGFCVALVQLK